MDRRRPRSSPETILSKTLSWLLRHGAVKERLPISPDGFIDLEVVLSHESFSRKRCRPQDIFRIVEADAKNRFTLKKCPQTGKLRIKANQGHSMSEVNESGLQKVSDPRQIPIVVHGTYRKHWENIRREGLKRMNRNHIHFARTDDPAVLSKEPISGFRSSCDVLVYLDVAAAMAAGIAFFISENQVILSAGIDGVIPPQFFLKALDRKSGQQLKISH